MAMNRLAARKVRIADILAGKFHPGSRETLEPSYVTDGLGRNISRVNVIVSVVDRFLSNDGNYMTLTVDDGSGGMRIKFFGEDVKKNSYLEIGNQLLIVGKVKMYNEELYLAPEVVKKVVDFNYISLRKLEVLKDLLQAKAAVDSIKSMVAGSGAEIARKYAADSFGMDEEAFNLIMSGSGGSEKPETEDTIVGIIKRLDGGGGVDLKRILEESGLAESDLDAAVTKLLEDGMIFEPTVGKFKAIG